MTRTALSQTQLKLIPVGHGIKSPQGSNWATSESRLQMAHCGRRCEAWGWWSSSLFAPERCLLVSIRESTDPDLNCISKIKSRLVISYLSKITICPSIKLRFAASASMYCTFRHLQSWLLLVPCYPNYRKQFQHSSIILKSPHPDRENMVGIITVSRFHTKLNKLP